MLADFCILSLVIICFVNRALFLQEPTSASSEFRFLSFVESGSGYIISRRSATGRKMRNPKSPIALRFEGFPLTGRCIPDPLPRTTIQNRRIARIRRRALTRVAASPTEGPDDVQRCNDGAIINRWYRHAYASHPLDLETQRLLTATMPPFAGIRCAQLDLHSRPARTNQ